MKKKAGILSILFLLLFISYAHTAGESSFSFLKIGASARVLSMGGIYDLDPDDISSLFYNPAALAGLNGVRVSLLNIDWLAQTRFNSFLAGSSFPGGGYGLGLLFQSTDPYPLFGLAGEDLNGMLNYYDLALLAGAGKKFSFADVGLTIKYLNSRLLNDYNTAVMVDAGAVYHLRSFSMGASLRNAGFLLASAGTGDMTPVTFSLSGSYQLDLGELHRVRTGVGADIGVADGTLTAGAGIEYLFMNLIALRAGYDLLHDLRSLSLGGSLTYSDPGKRYSFGLDYLFQPVRHFTTVHALALSVRYYPEKAETYQKEKTRQPPIRLEE